MCEQDIFHRKCHCQHAMIKQRYVYILSALLEAVQFNNTSFDYKFCLHFAIHNVNVMVVNTVFLSRCYQS